MHADFCSTLNTNIFGWTFDCINCIKTFSLKIFKRFLHLWAELQRELEETLHHMELENTRLDMALQHEKDKSAQLNRECSEARQVCKPNFASYLNSLFLHVSFLNKKVNTMVAKVM